MVQRLWKLVQQILRYFGSRRTSPLWHKICCHGNVPWGIGKTRLDRENSREYLPFGKKIMKIGPVDRYWDSFAHTKQIQNKEEEINTSKIYSHWLARFRGPRRITVQKSVNLLRRDCGFLNFQDSRRCHLEFLNSWNFIGWRCMKDPVTSLRQISSKSVNSLLWYCDIFRFLKMAAVRYVGFVWGIFGPPAGVLINLYHCGKFD